MPIMNTVIAGGGTTPTGTITITNNGITDVTNYANADVQVPTTAPALYREFELSANGILSPNRTTTHIMDFTGVTDVADYVLARAYFGNTAISGAVNMSDLTTINGGYACNSMFHSCTGIISVNLPALTTVIGANACNGMFSGCTGIISVNLPALTTISGNYACPSMFANCAGITSADLPALTTVSGTNACNGMFSGCTGIISVNLPALTTISGSGACSNMFTGCTSLATVYIGGTTAIDFGGKTNVFNSMFQNCTQNIDVYAPAANQTQIEAFLGYPKFGGTGNVVWHWRS